MCKAADSTRKSDEDVGGPDSQNLGAAENATFQSSAGCGQNYRGRHRTNRGRGWPKDHVQGINKTGCDHQCSPNSEDSNVANGIEAPCEKGRKMRKDRHGGVTRPNTHDGAVDELLAVDLRIKVQLTDSSRTVEEIPLNYKRQIRDDTVPDVTGAAKNA